MVCMIMLKCSKCETEFLALDEPGIVTCPKCGETDEAVYDSSYGYEVLK